MLSKAETRRGRFGLPTLPARVIGKLVRPKSRMIPLLLGPIDKPPSESRFRQPTEPRRDYNQHQLRRRARWPPATASRIYAKRAGVQK